MSATRIYVGTASWQEPDFIEFWYPRSLPKTRLLEYYSEHFNYVEVNGSFYGIPLAKNVQDWCERTPKDFLFDVKLHRLLSRHVTEGKFLPADLRAKAIVAGGRVRLDSQIETLVAQRFLEGIQPLIDSGKLGALLLQLSPSFAPNTHQLSELENLLGLFAKFRLAVELRHRQWLTGDQQSATVAFFKRHHVTLVSVDAPATEHVTIMPNVDFITAPELGYIRIHGRDATAYTTGKTVQERFDYEYNEDELLEIARRITGLASGVEAVHVVLNNNRRDFAPKAALLLIALIQRLSAKLLVVKPTVREPRLL